MRPPDWDGEKEEEAPAPSEKDEAVAEEYLRALDPAEEAKGEEAEREKRGEEGETRKRKARRGEERETRGELAGGRTASEQRRFRRDNWKDKMKGA